MNEIFENEKREIKLNENNTILDFEDTLTVKRVISRLCFIREDLRAINKINIKNDRIKREIEEIYEKINFLFELFLNKNKQKNDFI